MRGRPGIHGEERGDGVREHGLAVLALLARAGGAVVSPWSDNRALRASMPARIHRQTMTNDLRNLSPVAWLGPRPHHVSPRPARQIHSWNHCYSGRPERLPHGLKSTDRTSMATRSAGSTTPSPKAPGSARRAKKRYSPDGSLPVKA